MLEEPLSSRDTGSQLFTEAQGRDIADYFTNETNSCSFAKKGGSGTTLNTLASKKIFPRINFQYLARFSPPEYQCENHFFPSRPDLPKFYDKDIKINKMGCLYVVIMLKLTNKFNALHA